MCNSTSNAQSTPSPSIKRSESSSLTQQIIMPATWSEVVSAKRANRDALIATHRSTKIPEYTTSISDISNVDALLDLLKSGKVSAEEITLAYIQK